MDELGKKIEDLREKNMALLENKNKIPETEQTEENIKQNMQESQDALTKKMNKKSSKFQQRAVNEMKKLEEKLQDMQQSCGLEKPIEDMQSLRKILENLIRLSFDQEDLMTEAKKHVKKQFRVCENCTRTKQTFLMTAKLLKILYLHLAKELFKYKQPLTKKLHLLS